MNTAGLQLYSGSTSNQLYSNRADYGQNRDALEKAYRDALGEIREGRAKAAEEKAEREREAEEKRIEAAERSELDPQAAYEPKGHTRTVHHSTYHNPKKKKKKGKKK